MLNAYNRARILLILAAVISFLLFWWAGSWFGIPRTPLDGMSLMQQPGATGDLLVTAVVMLGCVIVGTAIAGTIRFDAGLFVASIGLMALSLRGGPMRQTLFAAEGPGVFLQLAGELAVLYALVALGWLMLWFAHAGGFLAADAARDGLPDTEHTLGQKCAALLVQTVSMAVLVSLLAQSDAKAQVLASVGIAAFLATALAHFLFPVRPSPWFWIGPLIVGLIGYFCAYNQPEGWKIGMTGWAMARPLPLDYAGAGTAGAIYGYWMSRRWRRERDQVAEESAAADAA